MGWLTDPLNWWVTPFTDNPFMRDALLAALLTVICTSVVGTWVVLRGLSFLGDALAHGVLPGIAIAWTLGQSTAVGALLAALAMVGGVSAIKASSPLPDDASIGVLFVGFLALAVVIMSARGGSGDLNRFLFGSITGVDTPGLTRSAIMATVTVVVAAVGHRAMVMTTFDSAQARVAGFAPRITHLALLVMTALAVVASFDTVGSLLVFAFLIAPPATASLVVGTIPRIMVTAVLIGSAAATIGLLISYHHRSAAGATMALVSVTFFLIGLLAHNFRTQRNVA